MNIYAISDLHLSFSTDKPMNVFGGDWEGHFDRIKEDWQIKVKNDDVVLIAGDISWAMNIEEAKADLKEIEKLNGKKIIIKGNHDYWWASLNKVKNICGESIIPLQNNAVKINNYVFCGTRGWTIPTKQSSSDDIKIYRREVGRLKLALDEAAKMKETDDTIVVLIHYPPFDVNYNASELVMTIREYGVEKVVYGHLHGKQCRAQPVVDKFGTKYILTSCDLTGNKLIKIY